jgi:DsbC/DsbD-like thiol-disulfide interchange protein
MYTARSLIAVTCLSLVAPVSEGAANVVRTPQSEVTLVSEVAQAAAGRRFWVGLYLKLRPGWHTYWTNPGDSGLATRIEWTLPQGLVAGTIRWPLPARFPTGNLMNYGYADEVVLLTRVSVLPSVDRGAPLAIAAHARWLVCAHICIPEEGRFELRLPLAVGAPVLDPRGRRLVARAEARLPRASPENARYAPNRDTLVLSVPLPKETTGAMQEAWFYPLEYGVVDHSAPQPFRVTADGVELLLTRGERRDDALEHLRGVLVIRHRDERQEGFTINAMRR